MAAIMVFGALSFHRLGISQLPDVDSPVVSVSLTLNGAAPEVIESQVLDPLEDAIMEIEGVRNVTSSAMQSSGSIAVEFELSRDIDEAMQEIQDKINQVRNLLPINLFPPTLRKSNPEDQPILWLALTSDDPNTKPIDMMIYARNTLYDQFSTIPGVGNIALGGYVDPALRVWTDLDKLDKWNMTADDVVSAIQAEQIETPAGSIENKDNEYFLRVMGEAKSPEEFGKILINNRSGLGANFRRTYLHDVATIEEGLADVRKITRINGKRAIGLGIIKQHGSNAVAVADAIRNKLAKVQPFVPKPFAVTVRSDNTRFIKQAVNQLIFTLWMSALLTSIVCFLFLGSWTSTFNILLAIPTSIVGAFIAFYAFGFTLNTFTMLGLSLAIGIVVDDAIMMLENIVRHQELGENRIVAAARGAKEITFAATAATIAVVAIFLPVVFMTGIIGKYLFQYGITVAAAVLLSLLEALTLTPMRCSRFLTVKKEERGFAHLVDRLFGKLAGAYSVVLGFLLRHRFKTVLLAMGIFAASIMIAKRLPGEQMPAQDMSMLMLRFKLPVGTAINVTNEKIKKIEDYLLKLPEVEGVFANVGGFGGDAVNQGNAFVTLVDPKNRKFSQAELVGIFRKDLKKQVPGMEIVVQDLSKRGFGPSRGFPIEFVVQGPNWEKLTETTNQVMDAMRKAGFATDVNTDVQAGMPEVQIIPNRQKLAEHGVAINAVTHVVNSLIGGAILNGQTEYEKGRHRYEIEERLISTERDKLTDLNRIKMRNNRGETVPLSELVEKKVQPSLMLISRLNRARAITVYANAAPGHSQQEALQKTEKLARSMLPPGYTFKMIGSAQNFQESIRSLEVAFLLGILVSYMVLASQFNSFIHPFTVLLALPFSITGAFAGLYLTNQSINMFSIIGFILLAGIVKKNSILLVDFTNQLRAEGLDVKSALLKACPIRLRPIIMTSVATIAGALPEALSIGAGSETMVPMAVSIIGGVAASTVLTLFVVPCFYSLATRLERPDKLELAEAAVRRQPADEEAVPAT